MNLKYKSPRKPIPVRIEKAVLEKSRRRCTLCFGLQNDQKEKRGQLAHLDGNRSNNAESNLAWMCLDHHSLFDSRTKQHKNYTISEVKEYRRRLYKVLHKAPQRSLRRVRRPSASKPKTRQAKRSAKITNSPVATGVNISQTVNSPTLNLSLPAPTSGTPGRERYDEWRELIDEIHESIEQMGWAFVPLVPVKSGDERNDYQAGVRRGNRVLGNRIFIADAVQEAGLKTDWDDLVQYTHSARGPIDRWQQGAPTMGEFDKKARKFQEKLMRIARQDVDVHAFARPEETGRPLIIPLRYGAAPTSAGKHMMGHHGLVVANHGEPAYDVSIFTSEIPIGTSKLQLVGIKPTLTKADGDAFFKAGIQESPGHGIMGNGLFDEMRKHHVAEITVELAYKDAENRWYKTVGKIERNVSEPGGLSVRYVRREQTDQPKEVHANIDYSVRKPSKMRTTDEDQSSWPDVILQCQWPSLVHESRIPGSHIVRKRPWTLRLGGPGAVYNVHVHRIDFGEYEAKFPSPVRTLTDTATVQPIICRKVDGRPDLAEVITTHDLESLIHNPPSGCDVGQYAVEIDGTEDAEIRLGDFVLEVEIPVTIGYEDKNGNQFKIKYLLHYDTYMEKGEMIRTGGIEKVALK